MRRGEAPRKATQQTMQPATIYRHSRKHADFSSHRATRERSRAGMCACLRARGRACMRARAGAGTGVYAQGRTRMRALAVAPRRALATLVALTGCLARKRAAGHTDGPTAQRLALWTLTPAIAAPIRVGPSCLVRSIMEPCRGKTVVERFSGARRTRTRDVATVRSCLRGGPLCSNGCAGTSRWRPAPVALCGRVEVTWGQVCPSG